MRVALTTTELQWTLKNMIFYIILMIISFLSSRGSSYYQGQFIMSNQAVDAFVKKIRKTTTVCGPIFSITVKHVRIEH